MKKRWSDWCAELRRKNIALSRICNPAAINVIITLTKHWFKLVNKCLIYGCDHCLINYYIRRNIHYLYRDRKIYIFFISNWMVFSFIIYELAYVSEKAGFFCPILILNSKFNRRSILLWVFKPQTKISCPTSMLHWLLTRHRNS